MDSSTLTPGPGAAREGGAGNPGGGVDLEVFSAMLARAGVAFEVLQGGALPAHARVEGDYTALRIHSGGYVGLYAEFTFDESGKLLRVGTYE